MTQYGNVRLGGSEFVQIEPVQRTVLRGVVVMMPLKVRSDTL